MLVTNPEDIFKSLWSMYGSYTERALREIEPRCNEALVDEFFFIVLGGFGISYEQNLSGLRVIKQKGYIDSKLYATTSDVERVTVKLAEELNTRQFEPVTKTGELRKYRFVETKPLVVASAAHWLYKECNWELKEKLYCLGEIEARQWLCRCPGIGLKSASWLLRNAGFCNDYAVFDVHIMRFLRKIGIEVPKTLTDKAYLQLEAVLRTICNKIGVALGIMDYLLWLLGRNGYLAYVG